MTRKIPKYDDYPQIGRLRLDPSLALANSDPLLIRRGLMTGASVMHKFGRNPAVPNGSWEGILTAAAQFVWPTTATTVRIKSGGNSADNGTSSPLGAGAHTVTVQGLDATGVEVSATLTTAGASASASTTQTFLRVYRAWVATAGAYTGTNTGDVVIETTAGTALIQITAGEGQSQYCAYTIPLGKTGYLGSVRVHVDGLKPADLRLFTRASCTTVAAPFTAKRLKFYWDGTIGSIEVEPVTPLLALPALTDVWIEARGSGAITEASANMEIILFDD